MDREGFLAGIAALKKEIKEAEGLQRTEKRIIRMPRKTPEDIERLRSAIHESEKGKKYPTQSVDLVQSHVACRKSWLTALYVTYNLVRGKSVAQRVDKHSTCEHYGYPKQLREARRIFDVATALVPFQV